MSLVHLASIASEVVRGIRAGRNDLFIRVTSEMPSSDVLLQRDISVRFQFSPAAVSGFSSVSARVFSFGLIPQFSV